MIVCVCRGVSERAIREAVNSGATCMDTLGMELGVGTQCGRCGDCARAILRDELDRHACPPPAGANRAARDTASA